MIAEATFQGQDGCVTHWWPCKGIWVDLCVAEVDWKLLVTCISIDWFWVSSYLHPCEWGSLPSPWNSSLHLEQYSANDRYLVSVAVWLSQSHHAEAGPLQSSYCSSPVQEGALEFRGLEESTQRSGWPCDLTETEQEDSPPLWLTWGDAPGPCTYLAGGKVSHFRVGCLGASELPHKTKSGRSHLSIPLSLHLTNSACITNSQPVPSLLQHPYLLPPG